MLPISKRLQTIVSMVPKCNTVADIGTDHGYVPAFLLLSGQCRHAIASDIAEGPCRSAADTRDRHSLHRVMEVRKAPGLKGLSPGEAETAVIAGMGGATIAAILEESLPLAKTVETFVLQPMNGAGMLRLWLIDHGLGIADEQLCKENGHIYVIIKAVQTAEKQELTDLQAEIGPCVLANKPFLWKEYVSEKAGRLQGLLTQMRGSPAAQNSDKYKNAEKMLARLETLLSSSP